jgi:hypothetical protein
MPEERKDLKMPNKKEEIKNRKNIVEFMTN